jgi:dinuclear metal center YbgI/SA1388 family protein
MPTTKVGEVAQFLETIAPKNYQEDYDNSGLLTGDSSMDVTGALVTLDCTEDVVEEAISLKCNLIVAHHPVIFRGLKKLTGKTYVERTIIKAIQHHIAIYAIHTNLDNMEHGVNRKIAERIGLTNIKILDPRRDTLSKIEVFIPLTDAERVVDALHEAGAGKLGNYDQCSFQVVGKGTFRPNDLAKPHLGSRGHLEKVEEVKAEMIFPGYLENQIIQTLKAAHPYEEVAYYLTRLHNQNMEVGAGVIGELLDPQEPMEFLKRLKVTMNTACVRHTAAGSLPVRKVAVCGGSGSFLLSKAVQAGADVFVTSDFKYHEFFDADRKVIVADIGHYESEQFTKELLEEVLKEKFSTFAINFSRTVTNPISYL